MQIFNSKTRKLVKTISRFGVDDTARSGTLRRDGRILLAGGDSGVIQAFDTGSRAILKQWRGAHAHKQPVHVVRWSPKVLTDLMSCSDDRTVRLWDLTEDEAKWTGIGHEDYIRSGCFLQDQEGMIVSGSYDQTVRIWDTRQQHPALTFKHASPIEHVLQLNSATLASAAGNEVSILNIVAGKTEHIVRSHQKTVTSLSTAQNSTRLATAGLDAHLKIHNTTSWEVVAGFKYQSPILSCQIITSGTDKEDRHIAVGLENGLLSLRTRLAGTEKVKAKEKEKRMQAMIAGEADEYERNQHKKDLRQGIRARDRGKDFRGEGADIVITGNDRSRSSMKKMQPWQKNLREGKYGKALDLVLEPKGDKSNYQPDDILTLVTALRYRSALRTALSNRNADQLIPILSWCLKEVAQPRQIVIVQDIVLLLLDLYSHKLAEWQEDEDGSPGQDSGKEVNRLIRRIEKRVRQGVDLAQTAGYTMGMVEMLEMG